MTLRSLYLTLTALASCWVMIAPRPALAGELARVKERGKLTMICFPQVDNEFVSANLERGAMKRVGGVEDFLGLDVEIMAAFARSLGVELEVRPTETPGFGGLIPALLAGEGDVIASYLSNTAARRARVSFSDPYHLESEVILTRQDSGIANVGDLQRKKAAAISGSAKAGLLEQLNLGDGDPIFVEFYTGAFGAVLEGPAAFTLVSGGSVRRVLDQYAGLAVAFTLAEQTPFGYAVRKGSDLLEPLNELLAELTASGKLEQLRRTWLGDRE